MNVFREERNAGSTVTVLVARTIAKEMTNHNDNSVMILMIENYVIYPYLIYNNYKDNSSLLFFSFQK